MRTAEETFCRPLKAGEFAKIRKLAYDTFGLDLRSGKEALVAARLGQQIRQSGCASFEEYYHRVVDDSSGDSLVHLIDALTTNHTSFFREPDHFDFLRSTLLHGWRDRTGVGIWSAACSSGEEPYSIAMSVAQELGPASARTVHILATDISTRALATARRGIYPAARLEGLSAQVLRTFWLRGEREWAGTYRAKPELRALIEFRRLNLLAPDAQVGRFALIFCRNVMIYFDKPTQQRVVAHLAGCLEPGGYLLTGHAESLMGVQHELQYVRPAVYRKPVIGGPEKGPW